MGTARAFQALPEAIFRRLVQAIENANIPGSRTRPGRGMARSDATHDAKDIRDPARIEEHRPYLLRYALLQLRDSSAAEDAVQETLLAALQTSSYEGRSSLRTWLTGILKHKIIDHLRRQSREEPLERPDDEPQHGSDDVAEALFADDGHWLNMPSEWGAPDRSLESSQFWKIFDLCVQVMPA